MRSRKPSQRSSHDSQTGLSDRRTVTAAPSFFVTGTDTNVGKTFVSCALLRTARAMGLVSIGYKPIESGCPTAEEPGLDAQALARAAGSEPHTTYMFAPPIAPHTAARQSGVQIDIARIKRRAIELRKQADFLLIEGAGGFLVPLNETQNISDLGTALHVPLILVAANKLGAINHTLLTIEAARTRKLPLAAVILTEPQPGLGDGLANLDAIRDYAGVTVFEFPHGSTRDLEAPASAVLEHLREFHSS